MVNKKVLKCPKSWALKVQRFHVAVAMPYKIYGVWTSI